MKKTILTIIILIVSVLLVGCGKDMSAREAVTDYLENYITLDSSIVEQLNEFVDNENLTEEQKLTYKEILRRQYSSLTYDIQNERYEGNMAYVKTKINVINLNKAQQDALDYYNKHVDEFNNNTGVYDKNLYTDYKLETMKKENETINYEIEFKLINEGNQWEVEQLSSNDLEKIHGVYSKEE